MGTVPPWHQTHPARVRNLIQGTYVRNKMVGRYEEGYVSGASSLHLLVPGQTGPHYEHGFDSQFNAVIRDSMFGLFSGTLG